MQQNTELPEGWVKTYLEQVCFFVGGKTPSNINNLHSSGQIPFYKVSDMNHPDNKKYMINANLCFDEDFIKENRLNLQPEGTVIFPKRGGAIHTNKKRILSKPSLYDLNIMGVVPVLISNLYLYYWFHSINLTDISDGSNVPQINNKNLTPIEILLPPLSEQHRIVSFIEALFALLDAVNEKLDRVPEILKKFKQSVLAAACDGRLTEDWRKENSYVTNPNDYLREIYEIRSQCSKKDALKFKNISELSACNLSELPDSWLWTPSNVIFSYVTSGSRGWAKYYSNTGSIFLRIGNLDRNSVYLKLEDIQRVIPPDSAEGRRTRIQKNDILISITADIGSIGYVCEEIGDAYINQHIALARPVQNLNPKYIAYFLHSQTGGKKQFEKLHRGATKIGLGLDDIRSIAIPLPQLPEQHEIAKRIDTLFAFADSIETRVAAAREKTERLRQSILTKAFSGELVETEAEIARREGRDYETAEVLLERIKKERGKSGKKQ